MTETLGMKIVSIVLRLLMKKEVTELKILNGARDLFYKHGIRTITMDAIAKHLVVSKKTIYFHYKDKNRLVKSMIQSELEEVFLTMKAIRKENENPIDEMLKIMEHIQYFMRKFNPVIFYDLQKFYPEAWAELRNFQDKSMIGFVEDNLKKGVKQALYRKEIKIKIIARLRMAEVSLGFNVSEFPPIQFSPTDVQVAMFEHFLHGIVTLKGHKMLGKKVS